MILIFSAFHKRAHISKLYWLGIERLRKNFQIKTLAITSDAENIELAKEYSDIIIETKNEPLGKKLNTGLKEAMNHDFNLMMQLGSDDLISNKGVETILHYSNQYHFFGFTDFIFFDSKTKAAKLSKQPNVFGCGRCISRQLFNEIITTVNVIMLESVSGGMYQYGKGASVNLPRKLAERWQQRDLCKITGKGNLYLWDDERTIAMDINSERRLEQFGYCAFPLAGAECIDVKSELNLWDYEKFSGEEISLNIVKEKISQKEFDYLLSL